MKKFILMLLQAFGFFTLFATDTTTTASINNPPTAVAFTQAIRTIYSKEVLFEALPQLKFYQFAKKKTDLQAASRGKGITFVRYNNLSYTGDLAEDADMNVEGIGGTEITINVSEKGNSVKLSELLMKTALLDTLSDATRLLAANYAVSLDTKFRDTVIATPNVIFGGGKASTTAMAGTDVFSARVVKDAVEILAYNNAPKIGGEYYVCIASPHQLRQLRDDSAWVTAQAYRGTGRQLYIGEVGMYEGVVFLETTQMPKLTAAQITAKYGAGHSLTNAWEAVFFGENAFGLAEALPVEIRDGGILDMGRKHQVGWYSIYGVGIIEPKNIVRAVTA
jgi:N4-gp56 family major capsid protein